MRKPEWFTPPRSAWTIALCVLWVNIGLNDPDSARGIALTVAGAAFVGVALLCEAINNAARAIVDAIREVRR